MIPRLRSAPTPCWLIIVRDDSSLSFFSNYHDPFLVHDGNPFLNQYKGNTAHLPIGSMYGTQMLPKLGFCC